MAPASTDRRDELAVICDEVEDLYASRGSENFTFDQQVRYLGLLDREQVLLDEAKGRLPDSFAKFLRTLRHQDLRPCALDD